MQNLKIPSIENDGEDGYIIREQIERYLLYWKWFAFSVLLCLFISFIYLRYATSEYKSTAIILIKDDKKGGIASEMSAFNDLGLMSGVKSNVDNEIEVLRARTLVMKVVKELGFTTSYFTEGRFKTAEAYKNSPINVNFFNTTENFKAQDTTFSVKIVSPTTFQLFDANENSVGIYKFGKQLKNSLGSMVVTNNSLRGNIPSNIRNKTVIVNVQSLDRVTAAYRGKLQVAPINKMTSVISLSVVDPVKEKGEDFLNMLIQKYNEDAIDDKNFVASNTDIFINQRLDSISRELNVVESGVETFMKDNRLTNIASEAGLFLETASEYKKNVVENATKLKVVESMLGFINKSQNEDVIPANIIPDGSTVELISQYNKLVLDRNRIAQGSTEQNPTVINLNNQLQGLRSSIVESLKNLRSSLRISQNDLQQQENILGGKISQVPRQQREFREIDRQQNVKEALYLYLLQKREENAITLAVTAPISKVIDDAYANPSPVAPRRNIFYLVAFSIGLLIPFLVIYIKELLDNKIHSFIDINKLSVPYLGDVPKAEANRDLVHLHSRSSTAESLRIIRTNLEFMLNKVPDGVAKTIFVTSTIPKEGKTFISINLSATIALSGKKILLLAMDIRNPKFDEYMKLPAKGLTNYLSTPNASIDDYIVKHESMDNFYILPPGVIPPNPAELLMADKVEEMFKYLQTQYDYLVVDTAPVSLVTDTLVIARFAHSFVYVTRANHLDKKMLSIPQGLYTEKRLPNMAILLNDTDIRKGYGYGYGYGYGQDVIKKPWYKRIFNI